MPLGRVQGPRPCGVVSSDPCHPFFTTPSRSEASFPAGHVEPLPRTRLIPGKACPQPGGLASDGYLEQFAATTRPATSTGGSEVRGLVESLPRTHVIPGEACSQPGGLASDGSLEQFASSEPSQPPRRMFTASAGWLSDQCLGRISATAGPVSSRVIFLISRTIRGLAQANY